MDKGGKPLSRLLDKNGELLSKTQFKKLEGEKLCTNAEFEDFKAWYEKYGDEHRRRLDTSTKDNQSLQTRELPFDRLMDVLKEGRFARQGGDQ